MKWEIPPFKKRPSKMDIDLYLDENNNKVIINICPDTMTCYRTCPFSDGHDHTIIRLTGNRYTWSIDLDTKDVVHIVNNAKDDTIKQYKFERLIVN